LISESQTRSQKFAMTVAGLLLLTTAGLLVHGYHYGIEDQAIYLPAIKQALNHELYPKDSIFFAPQTKATLSTWLVAGSARLLNAPVDVTVFAWHVLSVFLFLGGCLAVARRVFASERACWGSVAFVTALLTLPVTGTALYLVDQYLHPRTLAMAFVLFAVAIVLPGTRARTGTKQLLAAVALIAAAALIHVMMAFFGAVFVAVLAVSEFIAARSRTSANVAYAALALPLSQFFEPGTPEWIEAARTRSQHYLVRWEWFEWLGIAGPLVVLWWLASIAERKHLEALAALCRRTVWFGLGFFAIGLATIPAAMERITPYQPMRAFHIVYLVLVLAAGGLIADYVLKAKAWRWMLLFVPLCLGLFAAQRSLFEYSRHIEWPGARTGNPWVEAFHWVRSNTPTDAYFALDPHYISHPGEDYHGFRGLAERSQLADWDKDAGVVSLFPSVARRWHDEVHAILNWREFQKEDFARLNQRFGVDWVVIAKPRLPEGVPGVVPEYMVPLQDCPYQNAAVYVCRVR